MGPKTPFLNIFPFRIERVTASITYLMLFLFVFNCLIAHSEMPMLLNYFIYIYICHILLYLDVINWFLFWTRAAMIIFSFYCFLPFYYSKYHLTIMTEGVSTLKYTPFTVLQMDEWYRVTDGSHSPLFIRTGKNKTCAIQLNLILLATRSIELG